MNINNVVKDPPIPFVPPWLDDSPLPFPEPPMEQPENERTKRSE